MPRGMTHAGLIAAATVAALSASCASAPSRPSAAPAACRAAAPLVADAREPLSTTPRTRNVILVAVDGVRWQEIFNGVDADRASDADLPIVGARRLLPHIYRHLVDGGVALGAPGRGAPVYASGPAFASLPGYQELLGGRAATTCGGNGCAPIARATLLDDVRAELGLSPREVAAISSWERMERATSIDNNSIVLSAGRTHGPTRDALRVTGCASALLDDAALAGPGPGHADYRPDRYTAALALEYLRAARPRLLFVGLGDTDEHGHAHDYGAYVGALRDVDRFIGALFDTLAAMGRYGDETTVILTADHGWSDTFFWHGAMAPESSRVWLLAAGGAVPRRGLVGAARSYHLADVAPTARALLELPPPSDPLAGSAIPELLSPAPRVATTRP